MKKINIDFQAISRQFEATKGKHPGLWPVVPKATLLFGITAAVVGLGYYFYWSDLITEHEAAVQQEQTLRGDFRTKVAKAVNLEDLRRQKVMVEQYVGVLEKQLPSRAEMDALLSDINQAGVGRGAQLLNFKPNNVVLKDYYAELPISVKVSGNYNDLAAFSSDIANLPRIVTLNNLQITRDQKTQELTMAATAKTFRYLDRSEIEEQARAAAAAKKGQKK